MAKHTHRYARQTILPEIGENGQAALAKASVLCVGAGGLGCPALLYLTGAGIGHIGIVDFDIVDESNLQRQVLFTEDQRGTNKAIAAKEKLEALNSDINVTAIPERLSAQNIETLFSAYDIIIDGTDNFKTKFLINDTAVKLDKPFVYASILGFDGQVATFNAKNGPCYRCLFPHEPTNNIPNCEEAGIIGAVAGIIGSTQAMEAIKLIIAHEDLKPLIRKVWTLDLRSMENKILSLDKDPNCPICSKEKDEIKLENQTTITEISPEEAIEKSECLIVDVREKEEWDEGHVSGARHVPLSTLLRGENQTSPVTRTLFYIAAKA